MHLVFQIKSTRCHVHKQLEQTWVIYDSQHGVILLEGAIILKTHFWCHHLALWANDPLAQLDKLNVFYSLKLTTLTIINMRSFKKLYHQGSVNKPYKEKYAIYHFPQTLKWHAILKTQHLWCALLKTDTILVETFLQPTARSLNINATWNPFS